MKGVTIVIALLFLNGLAQFVSAGRSPGEITGYQKTDDAIRMSAAWYTWRLVIPAAITSDTIKTDSLFGAGYICRQIVNRTGTDGRVNAKDTKGNAFIALPIAGGQSSGITPSITKVLKSGTTIDTMIFYLQLQDTTQR